jgi:hypothetical protein
VSDEEGVRADDGRGADCGVMALAGRPPEAKREKPGVVGASPGATFSSFAPRPVDLRVRADTGSSCFSSSANAAVPISPCCAARRCAAWAGRQGGGVGRSKVPGTCAGRDRRFRQVLDLRLVGLR